MGKCVKIIGNSTNKQEFALFLHRLNYAASSVIIECYSRLFKSVSFVHVSALVLLNKKKLIMIICYPFSFRVCSNYCMRFQYIS